MKLLILVFGCAAIQAQSETTFTNNVPIGDYVIRLIVCDNFYGVTNVEAMASEREVNANSPLFLVRNNSSSKEASVLFPRESPLAFELRSTDGVMISKTSKGESMSRRPSSLRDLRTGVRSGAAAGQIQAQDFPKLTDLFNFPSNGVYSFELKHWMWDQAHKKYVLSDPVRLKVVKRGTIEENSKDRRH